MDVVVPLHSRRLRRALILQKLNHAVPTVGLVFSGVQALQHGARGFELALALTEIVTSVAGKPFMAFRATWKDIAGVTVGDASAEIRTRVGRIRRVDLLDLENAAEVRAALYEAQRRARAAAVPSSC
jgi:hypothetical protein